MRQGCATRRAGSCQAPSAKLPDFSAVRTIYDVLHCRAHAASPSTQRQRQRRRASRVSADREVAKQDHALGNLHWHVKALLVGAHESHIAFRHSV